MAENETMEDRLKRLVEANKPENRNRWALESKKQGKKVMGMLCTYVPEEILAAGGIFPWRITGTWREAAPLAASYRPEMTCRYCSHVLESVLAKELDFLDGVVTTQVDDDFKRLWDVLHYIKMPPFSYIMYLPHTISDITLGMWTTSILKFRRAVEDWTGKKIKKGDLVQQIRIFNKMRDLLQKVYELRKREVPPLTGVEALGITTAARVMPKEEFNRELEAILPYIEKRTGVFKSIKPRLLLSSEYLDHPSYVELVESCGAAVVMDDFDTGSKYFWRNVDESKNPWQSLAERYINKPGTARMANWNEQADQMIKWVKEFSASGVVELRQLYSPPLDYRYVVIRKKFENANIPYISLSREYHLSNVGMLRTRVEAFVEMIQGRVQ